MRISVILAAAAALCTASAAQAQPYPRGNIGEAPVYRNAPQRDVQVTGTPRGYMRWEDAHGQKVSVPRPNDMRSCLDNGRSMGYGDNYSREFCRRYF